MTGRFTELERVVIINDSSIALGGATFLAVLLANGLAADDIPVSFFAGDAGAEIGPGVETVALGHSLLLDRPPTEAVLTGLYNVAAGRSLARFIAREDTPGTVYHLHGWSRILSPAVFRALCTVRERVVLHAHDYSLACPNVTYFDFPNSRVCGLVPLSRRCIGAHCDKRSYPQKLWRVARHLALRHAARPLFGTTPVIVPHERMQPMLQRAGIPGPFITVRNPASPFCVRPVQAERNSAIFYVGRLDPLKGCLELARAAAEAGSELQVIGDGPEHEAMRRIHPATRFHGWKAKSEIGPLLERARAVVVPTRSNEPFGLVTVEALTSGLPVIVSDAINLATEVSDHRVGLTFASGRVDALAGCLRRIAADDVLVAGMSRRAVCSGWQMASTVDDWRRGIIAVYRSRLDPAPAPRDRRAAADRRAVPA